jgi:hypothetical protein
MVKHLATVACGREYPHAVELCEELKAISFEVVENPPVNVGTRLYGYCGGQFGRDSYDEKVVEAIGRDWVVVRDSMDDALFANVEPGGLAEYATEAARKEMDGGGYSPEVAQRLEEIEPSRLQPPPDWNS